MRGDIKMISFAINVIIIFITINMNKIKTEVGTGPRVSGEAKSGATATTGSSSLTSNSNSRSKNRWNNTRGAVPAVIDTFKGANPELKGKVFVMGPAQASKYDEAYKALLTYLGAKFDHKIHRAFEHKDATVGTNMLIKPSPPMTTRIVQEASVGDNSVLTGVERDVLDKDGVDFVEYQIDLKQYLSDRTKYTENLQRCFTIIMGQCSPSMEQALEAELTFKKMKATSDSIGLIQTLERICYSYQSHEYAPLGAWEAMDKLGRAKQPDDVQEANHYETFRTIVEVCKASGINFALLCDANVDMAMEHLYKEGTISQGGKFKEGAYYKLNDGERSVVDNMAEEICLSTRFLSLSNNKTHYESKQELKNDKIKGKDNYPRTIAGVLNFLQYHNLRGKGAPRQRSNNRDKNGEIIFTQRGEKDDGEGDNEPKPRTVSKTCREYEDGTCAWKEMHTWKQCPNNPWSRNKGKKCNDKGELILCTVDEFEDALVFNDDDMVADGIYPDGDGIEDDKINETISFYSINAYTSSSYTTTGYLFALDNFVQRCGSLLTQNRGIINKYWVLLDSQSTIDLFCNSEFLTNIRELNERLEIFCNAGSTYTNMVGDLEGYGTVWYYPEGIANILSLHRVARKYHVQYDSRTTEKFIVWRDDGSTREFNPGPKGLYYCDYSKITGVLLATDGIEDEDNSRVSTVKENMKQFTQRQIKTATVARTFQDSAGLTTKALIRVIDNKLMNNSPITRESIKHAISIWGPSKANLKGKSTQTQSDVVVLDREVIMNIPPEILQNNGDIILGMDVVKVNKIPFLVSISRVVRFGTVTEMWDMKITSIIPIITNLTAIYRSRGFRVLAIAADGAFEPMRQNQDFIDLKIDLNICAENEHEPYSERFNRTIKERCRMCFSTLPFTSIPRRMTVELVSCMVFWYNFITPEDYISNTLGPGSIVTGRTYDYNMLCGPGSIFGEYVQTNEKTDNTMKERTVSAITLRPTGNTQGSFYYYSLATGRRLRRGRCTPIPMPQEVIDRVHAIAQKQNCPEGFNYIRCDGSIFEDIPGEHVQDINDNDPVVNNIDVQPDGNGNETIDGEVDEVHEEVEINEEHDEIDVPNEDVDELDESVHNDIDDVIINNEATVEALAEEAEEVGVRHRDDMEHIHPADDTTPTLPVVHEISEDNILPEGRRKRTKPSKYGPDKGYNFANISEESGITPEATTVIAFLHAQTAYVNAMTNYNEVNTAIQSAAEHLALTQLGMKAGVRAWGQEGVEAIVREMKQFHDREVVKPLLPHQITPDIKMKALGYLMFLKKKRNGVIKGRGCADGRPQRIYKTKEETSSPTVCIESIFISSVIDHIEKRDIAHVDIPGAFLQTEASDGTIIKLQGAVVDALIKINPSWEKYVVKVGPKRIPTIYSEAIKALYGTVDASKLFFDNLCSCLIDELGFERNDYDMCVVNKIMNGKQCTILWHVDDLKISHVDPEVVTSIIKKLDEKYGDIMPLSVSRGKIHDYLGMVFDYTVCDEVKITMYQYIDGLLDNVPAVYLDGIGMATPAPENLYDIRDPDSAECELLSDKEREEYHSLTAQCLYLSKRGRSDLQTAIAFHCTRVKKPDRDDQKKLGRAIRYLKETRYLPLILSMDDNGVIEWWVDASFAVHDDMRSRTGMNMSLGRGAIYCASTKQKLNTGSTTHSELVAVDDAMPKILWCRYFIESQGYTVEDVYVYQDNQSAILLENNGPKSVGKGSRHIKIKYFFVTDKIKDKELKIVYCPTKEMIADFFTKPLQGKLFVVLRNAILGLKHEDMPLYRAQYEEYVKSIECIDTP